MNPEQQKDKLSILESVLFVYGEPVKFEKLKDVLGLSLEATKGLVLSYENKILQDASSGLFLIKTDDEVQLGTKPQNHARLEKFLKQDAEEELSSVSVEVLTIILYRGPISRSEVDFIRGVNSSYILRVLLMRGLIQREKRGLSFLYRPSFDLLKLLGLSNQKDLPEFEVLNQRLSDLTKQIEAQETEGSPFA